MERRTKPEPTERVLDARSLRGLAHPLRIRMLTLLRTDGPATATQLGNRLGESSGTTSWHLRQLAEYGFIEEVRGRGTARERWWQAAQQRTRLTETVDLSDPETRGALDVYLHEVLTMYFHRTAAFLAEREGWGEEWNNSWTLSNWELPLTAAETRDLLEQLERLIESFRREPRPGDALVEFQLAGYPRRRPADPSSPTGAP
ncbi:MAG: helix-turn-helix domain-containing protein [Actinomycetota bacterium]|nr:helix-turn-helix domain-containing protein [Actinomycetota bacterium]